MQIAICDDIRKELETVRAALDTYAKAHPELHFDIDEYDAAKDILGVVEKGKVYDIVLLDVFLSTSGEYAVSAFALNATHYLLKPFSQEQFNEALDRAVKKTEDRDFLSLACVDGMYRVCVTEIVSIESQNHYLLLNLSSGEILRLRMKLSQMFEELQEYSGFIKVGVSYVVNLAFVRKISGNTLEMFNGIQISIPRRGSEEVQKTYMDFCRREALK